MANSPEIKVVRKAAVQYGDKKKVPEWVQVWIPKDFAQDLQPTADANKMTLSDIVTIMAIEGIIYMQARQDLQEAEKFRVPAPEAQDVGTPRVAPINPNLSNLSGVDISLDKPNP